MSVLFLQLPCLQLFNSTQFNSGSCTGANEKNNYWIKPLDFVVVVFFVVVFVVVVVVVVDVPMVAEAVAVVLVAVVVVVVVVIEVVAGHCSSPGVQSGTSDWVGHAVPPSDSFRVTVIVRAAPNSHAAVQGL